jgi:hypothetical protein
MKKIHEGKSYWLNTVSMTCKDINTYLRSSDETGTRLLSFFYLGLSLANLLQAAVGMDAVRDSLQLFEEWEYHFSSFSVQSVKYVMARSIPTAYPETDASETSPSSHYTINRFSNEVMYSKLQCPHVSYELKHTVVVHALCEVLAQLYEKVFSTYTFRYVCLFWEV